MNRKIIEVRHLFMPFLVAILLILNACGKKAEAETSLEAEAIASGPFFTGPNSLIAEKNITVQNLVEGAAITSEQLKSIHLLSVNVRLREIDSLDFSYFNDASLSIVSSDQEMISIATLNPIEASSQEIELSASQEADLVEYFKGEKFSLIVDLGLKEDIYLEEMGADVNLKLKVTYKP